jgi:hypothetical protein
MEIKRVNLAAVLMSSIMKQAKNNNKSLPKPQRTTTVFLKAVDRLLKVRTIELKC